MTPTVTNGYRHFGHRTIFCAPQEDILEGINSSISCTTHLLLEMYLLDSPRLSSLVKEHYRRQVKRPIRRLAPTRIGHLILERLPLFPL